MMTKRDFSNPKKLGFMRLIQILFAINVIFTIFALSFVIKDSYTLTFDDALLFANLIFDGISFWLIWNRKAATRWFIIAFSLFNITVGAVYNFTIGDFDLLSQIGLSLFDWILFFYFLTSRRVKATLVKPLATEGEALRDERECFAPRKWVFWRDNIIYFCVFSVVGHWMEAGYCTLIRFGLIPGAYDPNSLIWTDWLYPFLVYGVGFVMCVLIFFPIKNFLQNKFKTALIPILLTFVISSIVCSLIELVMGLILNQPRPDGTFPLWNYSNMFCNFMGQICLQNALAFGFVATLITWVVYPFLEKQMRKLPKDAGNIILIGVCVAFAILFAFYCINILVPSYDDVETIVSSTTSSLSGSASNASS